MTRHGIQFPLYEGTDTGGAGGGDKDAAYYQNEAKKAFADRDAAKKALRELQDSGAIMSPEDRKLFDELKKQQKQLEEDKLKKAGEFDQLRQQLVEAHAKEVDALKKQVENLGGTLRTTLVGREFAGASALFGKDAKTILTPKIAEAYYGRYVEVQDVEGTGEKIVVVKNQNGQVILDPATGRPADFATAMGQLIESLPDKDAVLRGSGKTGSGSSGGAGGGGTGQPVTLQNLKQSDLADPDKRAELKKQLANAGGMQIGSAFDSAKKAS
jgi:hypothetical protein